MNNVGKNLLVKPKFGLAWILLTVALALHVADEALNDFLQFYNPAVTVLREKFAFIPMPTFTFDLWLGGLITGIIILFALSPFAFKKARWILGLAYFYGILMVLNGLGHLAASLAFGYFIPGTYSSPFLIITAVYLVWSTIRTKNEPR